MLSRVKRRVTDYFCDFLSSLDSWGVDQVHALDALEAVTLIVTEILAEVVRFGVCAPAAVGVYPREFPRSTPMLIDLVLIRHDKSSLDYRNSMASSGLHG